jgi:hypothetical protein
MDSIVEILTSLLTGGVLVLFIESQYLTSAVHSRYDFIMVPFMKSLTAYLRFLSFFKGSYRFNKEEFFQLKGDIDYLARIGGQTIVAGRNIPTTHFSSEEFCSICKRISNIWYIIDCNRHAFYSRVKYEDPMFSKECLAYLLDVSSKYNGHVLTDKSLEDVSGSFYTEFCAPVEDVPAEYEAWQEVDKEFRIISYVSIGITLFSLLLFVVWGDCINRVVYGGMCFLSLSLFAFQLFLNVRLYRYSLKIFN